MPLPKTQLQKNAGPNPKTPTPKHINQWYFDTFCPWHSDQIPYKQIWLSHASMLSQLSIIIVRIFLTFITLDIWSPTSRICLTNILLSISHADITIPLKSTPHAHSYPLCLGLIHYALVCYTVFPLHTK